MIRVNYSLLPRRHKKKISDGYIASREHSFYEDESHHGPYLTEYRGVYVENHFGDIPHHNLENQKIDPQSYVFRITGGTPENCSCVIEPPKFKINNPISDDPINDDPISVKNKRYDNNDTNKTGKFRYVIFFTDSSNRNNDIFFTNLGYRDDIVVQQISGFDDKYSIIVPYDTECFCYIRTDMQADEVRKKFEKCKFRYELGLPIENNTLYVVLDMEPSILNLTQEINRVKIEDVSGFNFKRPKDIKARYSKWYYRNAYDEVILYYNGEIEAVSANWEFGSNFTLDYKYDTVLRTINTVSKENPEIYEAIIEHIPYDVKNPNYKLLREYCIKAVRQNYERTGAVLKKVRKP